jgi:hypothetical protein
MKLSHPTEIVEISPVDVKVTNEEILADLLYPEPIARRNDAG